MDALIPAAYSDTFMPLLYHGDATVFLGDCAHSTSPQLGQGANLAIEDGYVLARCLIDSDFDPAVAFPEYYATRHARISDVIRARADQWKPQRDGRRQL